MARRRVSFSVDEISLEFLQAAADRAGLTLSAWLSRAAQHEAVRQGAPSGTVRDDRAAVDDDADRATDEAHIRATG